MTVATEMIKTYPVEINLDRHLIACCIEARGHCDNPCTACVDACLRAEMVDELRKCIRTNLDCADVCDDRTGAVAPHRPRANLRRTVLEACAQACKNCGDECGSHANIHEHCRVCAEACRRCEQARGDVLAAIG